jgi:hypothetical protein
VVLCPVHAAAAPTSSCAQLHTLALTEAAATQAACVIFCSVHAAAALTSFLCAAANLGKWQKPLHMASAVAPPARDKHTVSTCDLTCHLQLSTTEFTLSSPPSSALPTSQTTPWLHAAAAGAGACSQGSHPAARALP